ncbi:heme-degrading domain-containing protein [Sphingomonas sp. G-3-2-10]|uniref:heme-degrading domain-containing protein n=1 Tax=Sphingomonas sp. G-3-2-10 TaxID=2728838 RepID=UPI00146F5454|nr:heme-degrading domain-containing protein [Sphingomonas sp. G-3-2-10]
MTSERTVEQIDGEEQTLTLRGFDADDAWWLGCHLRDRAARESAPIAIDIQRAGTTLFQTLLPGATLDNLNWTRRKIAIALRFERSSYALNLWFRTRENMFERFGLDRATHMDAGGAVPIRIRGTGVIGAVAISGLAQEVDHQYAVDALAALRAHQDARGAA